MTKKITEQEMIVNTFVWMAGKLFKYLSLYTPKCGSVEGVVVTNDKDYLDYCNKYKGSKK